MIRLLSIEDEDGTIRSYVICPNCDIKIMYTEKPPYLCPICQADISPMVSYLINSVEARIHYYESNFCIMTGHT